MQVGNYLLYSKFEYVTALLEYLNLERCKDYALTI